MNDIYLEWGSDLVVGSSGDIALASGTTAINQRICRRLLTNQGDYLWNLAYGGGLSQFVGSPANAASIEAIVTTQLLLETAVPSSPAPQIKTRIGGATDEYVSTQIIYSDPASNLAVAFDVTVN